jgi:hypothetical protein
MVAPCLRRRPVYAVAVGQTLGARRLVREAGPPEAPKPRLLDRVRQAIGARHYSRRTEKAYVHWIKRCISSSTASATRPRWAPPKFTAFLTSRAVQSKVAASTQNQALSALQQRGAPSFPAAEPKCSAHRRRAGDVGVARLLRRLDDVIH